MHDLIAAIKIFMKIYETELVDENDYNNLSNLNLQFVQLNIDTEEIKIHSSSIEDSVLNTIFTDLMLLASTTIPIRKF